MPDMFPFHCAFYPQPLPIFLATELPSAGTRKAFREMRSPKRMWVTEARQL